MAAHRRYCDGKTLATGYDTFQDIIFFVKFIAREDYTIEDISDITATLLHRYQGTPPEARIVLATVRRGGPGR